MSDNPKRQEPKEKNQAEIRLVEKFFDYVTTGPPAELFFSILKYFWEYECKTRAGRWNIGWTVLLLLVAFFFFLAEETRALVLSFGGVNKDVPDFFVRVSCVLIFNLFCLLLLGFVYRKKHQ